MRVLCFVHRVSVMSSGLSLVESFPYEPEERGFDYVRLASIAAGDSKKKMLFSSDLFRFRHKNLFAVILCECVCAGGYTRCLMTNTLPLSACVLALWLWGGLRAALCCCSPRAPLN